jgi:dihydroorotate dehydrogenase
MVPLMRGLDPERAHSVALRALSLGLAGADRAPDDPALAVEAMGLRFPQPGGLAAGFDKDAVAALPLLRLGFGFVETGSVTPRPQPGNPRPRLFRLEEDRAVINRMGFNNGGVEAYVRRSRRCGGRCPASSAPTSASTRRGAIRCATTRPSIAAVAPHADYVVVNVSSPNTPGLRDLQGGGGAGRHPLGDRRDARGAGGPTPAAAAQDRARPGGGRAARGGRGLRGAWRAGADRLQHHHRAAGHAALRAPRAGGRAFRRAVVRAVHRHAARGGDPRARARPDAGGRGGVSNGEQALAKIRAGASLVQLHYAFALYEGPAVVGRIRRELLPRCARDGFSNVSDAVGADLR